MSAPATHHPPSYARPLIDALRAARCARTALDAAAHAPLIAADCERARYALTLAVRELERITVTGGLRSS